MTHCVRRVWPGMLAAFLLAGTAFAAPAQAARVPDRHMPRAHVSHASHERVRGKPKLRVAARRRPPATTSAPAHTTAFIDDGFSFLERRSGQPAWKQTGVASWYGGSRWHGKPTSSGAIYDENALTAAHATLPLGSKIKVALHHSDKFVIVTITDRPGTRSRIIDLSKGAAAALGMLDQGIAMVTLSPQ